MCKVSVIVPIYNVEKYLDRCLKSLQRQSFTDFEVLMVDDGSTDRSYEIAFSYVQKDKRFHLWRQKNSGSGSAPRNRALAQACGDYLMFLDSDDYYLTHCVEEAYRYITQTSSDVVVYGSLYQDEEGNVVKHVLPAYQGSYVLAQHPEIYGTLENCTWDKIIRRSLLEKCHLRFPEGLYYQDYYFTFSLLRYVDKIAFLAQELHVYTLERSHNTTLTFNQRAYDIFTLTDLLIADYQKAGLWEKYQEELKAIAFINILDRMKRAVQQNKGAATKAFLQHANNYIKQRLGGFSSCYPLCRSFRDWIYFYPLTWKSYLMIKKLSLFFWKHGSSPTDRI